jgi:hypothetical protein
MEPLSISELVDEIGDHNGIQPVKNVESQLKNRNGIKKFSNNIAQMIVGNLHSPPMKSGKKPPKMPSKTESSFSTSQGLLKQTASTIPN